MQIYLVGGAVRNQLLSLPVKERDWVVVGSDEGALLSLGYRRVGKSFPVFLHPDTQEEYALARRELKTGAGYKGFECETGIDISLEEDLKRRDLTINAMAMDEQGKLIDPYQGEVDIANKTLRHVSPAFAEDPLRVLRVARFAAVLEGFEVHPDTMALMQSMAISGELDHLVSERVWIEVTKALLSEAPQRFFDVLSACGAMQVLFPELLENRKLTELLAKAAVLTAAEETHRLAVRWAACCYQLSQEAAQALMARLRVPKESQQLADLVVRYVPQLERLDPQQPEKIVGLLASLDAWRRGRRLQCFFLVCQIVYGKEYPGCLLLCRACAAAQRITAEDLLSQGYTGQALGEALFEARVEAVKERL